MFLPHPRSNYRLLALTAILLLAFALRCHAVETRSLWEDEGWTMLLSTGPSLGEVTRTLAADQHPPLFFILFRLWRDLAGDTEFASRFFSVLISLIAVAGMAQLGRALFSPTAGLAAALFLALADLPIDLAQEVRHYSLLATLMVFSSLYYVRWWRVSTRANRIGYVLTSIALLYTHYLGGFVLVAQFAHVLLATRPWRRLREALFLFGAVFVGFLPWLPVVIDQNRLRWENPLYYQNALPNNHSTLIAVRNATLGHNAALLGGLVLLGLAAVVIQNSRVRLRMRPFGPTLYLLLWVGIMTGITVVLNERRQFLTVRNFIVIVPPLVLLAARGVTNLPRHTRMFMLAVVLVVSLTTVDARRHYPDWRTVTHNITRFHLNHEPVLMDVWVGDFPVRYYVTQQMGSETPAISLREWRDQYKGQFLPTLLHYLQQQPAFWLISWNNHGLDEYGYLIVEAGFQRTATLWVDHLGTPIYSYRYDRLATDTTATFGDLFTLHSFGAPRSASPGDTITVSLWWSAKQTLPLDYSVSVFVLDAAGTLVAQHDGSPLDGQAATSTWTPGAPQFDVHSLTLPTIMPAGTYTLGVKVYWYGDNQPLPVQSTAGTSRFARLGSLAVLP